MVQRIRPAVLVALIVACASCRAGGDEPAGVVPSGALQADVAAPGTPTPRPASSLPPATPPTTSSPPPGEAVSPLAAKIVDVGDASPDAVEHETGSVMPATLSVPTVDVNDATVEAVGVLPDGRLEVPEASVVGWYRFGPGPLDSGTSVLAAHLNYDGVDGVFRHLADVEVGAEIVVTLANGTALGYRVTEVRLIDKNLLPPDEVWNRHGPSRLVLITCGGRYDAARRGYDDNVVVFAEPW